MRAEGPSRTRKTTASRSSFRVTVPGGRLALFTRYEVAGVPRPRLSTASTIFRDLLRGLAALDKGVDASRDSQEAAEAREDEAGE